MSMRSPNRKHERENFYKYMSANTALAVLENRTLRWSSPLQFNDPFDVPRELTAGVDAREIVNALGTYTAQLIENPPNDLSFLQPKLRLLIEMVNSNASEEKKRLVIQNLKDPNNTLISSSSALEALRNLWKEWIKDYRILCLTESPNHIAMWYHYADSYKGVAIEFSCIDELDSAWLAAESVTYPSDVPSVYTAEGWAQILSMNLDNSIHKLFQLATYTKSPDWSYEREWRLATFKRPSDTGLYTDYHFHPREITSIFLGPLMDQAIHDQIVKLASNYPNIRIFKLSIGISRNFDMHELRT